MRDAVLNKCTSVYVKRKLLEEGDGLTLARTLQIAQQCENVESQLSVMSLKNYGGESVNRVSRENTAWDKGENIQTGRKRDTTCYRCGKTGHFVRDSKGPTKGQSCHNCGGKDHFATVCRTKKRSVNLVDDDTSNDPDYASCLESGSENDSNMLQVEVDNVVSRSRL